MTKILRSTPPTAEYLALQFFDYAPASDTVYDLRSVLYKAMSADDFNDADYRTEMVATFDRVTTLITNLAIVTGHDPINL